MKKLLPLALIALVVAGCASGFGDVPRATAPIAMSETALFNYKDWASKPYPQFFALSRGGRASGHVWCQLQQDCGTSQQAALMRCERDGGTSDGGCVLYGERGRAVVEDSALAAYLAATNPALSTYRANAGR